MYGSYCSLCACNLWMGIDFGFTCWSRLPLVATRYLFPTDATLHLHSTSIVPLNSLYSQFPHHYLPQAPLFLNLTQAFHSKVKVPPLQEFRSLAYPCNIHPIQCPPSFIVPHETRCNSLSMLNGLGNQIQTPHGIPISGKPFCRDTALVYKLVLCSS